MFIYQKIRLKSGYILILFKGLWYKKLVKIEAKTCKGTASILNSFEDKSSKFMLKYSHRQDESFDIWTSVVDPKIRVLELK